jgi:acetolactate synthase-1/3 small subunit
MEKFRKVISVIVLNEHSVLSRLAGLFAGRGYNISTLTVAPIPNSEYSRFTIVTEDSQEGIEQITKQINKLVPVLKVIDSEDIVEKEMVLIKFPLSENLSDIDTLCNTYNGSIVNVTDNEIVTMIADEPQRVSNFLNVINRYNPTEIVRGGVVSIER